MPLRRFVGNANVRFARKMFEKGRAAGDSAQMRLGFRNGFYLGLGLALIIGAYLFWLWQPERQVRLHNEHLLAAVEAKNWSELGEFIDDSYQDQWGNDRTLLLTRLREILNYARHLRIEPLGVGVRRTGNEAECSARITIDADANEVTPFIKDRVNPLESPFVFKWQHGSSKPWDWKLNRVSNEALELPASLY